MGGRGGWAKDGVRVGPNTGTPGTCRQTARTEDELTAGRNAWKQHARHSHRVVRSLSKRLPHKTAYPRAFWKARAGFPQGPARFSWSRRTNWTSAAKTPRNGRRPASARRRASGATWESARTQEGCQNGERWD